MPDLDGRGASARGRRIGHELGLDAAVHGAKEERRSVDGFGHGQDAVVLENDGFGGSERVGDAPSFFVCEDDAAEIVVDGVVVVEAGARISVDTPSSVCMEFLFR
jgi:hypothetical protein